MSFLHEGSIGIFGFGFLLVIFFFFGFCAKELWFFSFGVHCSYTHFPFSVFIKNTNEFLDLVSDVVFSFFLFGRRCFFNLSDKYAAPLISNAAKTTVCSTCHHCIGLSVLTVLQAVCGFRF